ncbi:hypothetical protein B1813_16740 [Saccharomonospora piscinae]|uniref:Uncharacterized protein n=1 Tax=Saccharomonospora piscinae TaxID=687388 RepID=A0A1V9A2F9_SACPI|nr:hypothetical protein [Saccharomonospora piscinae]OQO91134.1 hypothetical protein B1813_16740 [Saccharomonospora piscinae]
MTDGNETRRCGAARPLDPFGLLAGLATLCVAAYLLSDADGWLGHIDLRWAMAGTAVGVGLLMLVSSLRPRRDRR